MNGINLLTNDSTKKIRINMAQGAHKITAEFEEALCKYTGAPFAVALDNASNALFLALIYFRKNDIHTDTITVPKNTYPSVPCEIIHSGFNVRFSNHGYNYKVTDGKLTGAYRLWPSNVWDSALRLTCNMYIPNTYMCLSFTGPYKHLKLGKGGAILTDNEAAYKWFKKARFSGRDECSYHEDDFDKNPVIGWNFYMMPEIAARGILLMGQFYENSKPKDNPDLTLPYPDLSKFKLWQ
jgi:dTDP-4-amino-4,6-dideoxygalactose transaminase